MICFQGLEVGARNLSRKFRYVGGISGEVWRILGGILGRLLDGMGDVF